MSDELNEVGKGKRIRTGRQKQEVEYIKKKFNITGMAALGAIRAAGPMREDVYAYIEQKKNERG